MHTKYMMRALEKNGPLFYRGRWVVIPVFDDVYRYLIPAPGYASFKRFK